MSLTNSLETAACAGSLTIHAIAARSHFVAPEGFPARMKLIAALFFLFGAANVWTLSKATIDPPYAIASLLAYAGALWLFSAAWRANRGRPLTVAFTPDIPGHLVTSGPYRFIRHPFYTSYCLTWFAGAAGARSALLFSMFAGMTLAYSRAARFEEQKFLRSDLGPAYAAYCTNTGMFIPVFGKRGETRNREMPQP